jgi:DNA-binding response OmpR family regulator
MAARHCRHILLVDSDAFMLDLLKFALQDSEWKLHVATDGQEALEAVARFEPDLVITELILPVMDGVVFLRRLREQYPCAPPVLVLTALDRPGIHDEITALGIAGLIYKPFRRSDLLRRVRTLLRKRPAAGTAAAG